MLQRVLLNLTEPGMMMRNLLILVFASLFLTVACGGSGSDDRGGSDNLNLRGITPDDVDCVNDPDLNHIEPLPSGSHPSEFVTEEGTFFRCENADIGRYADGTLAGTWTGDFNDELYTLLRIAQETCDLGTEKLPNYAADWVVTDAAADDLPYSDLCFRIDLLPGSIFCQQLSGKDQEAVRQIQYGQVVGTDVPVNDETCALEEE